MTLEQFLAWATEPSAVSVLAGGLLAVLAEYFPWWYPTLAPKRKKAVFLAVCLLIPVIFAFLRLQAGYVTDSSFANLYWPALASGFAAFSAGTGVHMVAYQGKGKK